MVAMEEGFHERDECERVGGIGEQSKVSDELVFRGYLKIIAGLGLSVVHGILLHAHERGVGVGLRHGVALTDLLQTVVILVEFLTVSVQLLYLPFFFPTLRFLLPGFWGMRRGKGFLEFGGQLAQHCRRELDFIFLCGYLLGDDLINLLEEDTYLLHEFGPVLL